MPPTTVDLPTYFRLFGDPLKFRIITTLFMQSMPVKALTKTLSSDGERIARPTVSNALTALEECGIVSRGKGRVHVCSVNKDLYKQVMKAGLELAGEERDG